jgi:hypothetical protein
LGSHCSHGDASEREPDGEQRWDVGVADAGLLIQGQLQPTRMCLALRRHLPFTFSAYQVRWALRAHISFLPFLPISLADLLHSVFVRADIGISAKIDRPSLFFMGVVWHLLLPRRGTCGLWRDIWRADVLAGGRQGPTAAVLWRWSACCWSPAPFHPPSCTWSTPWCFTPLCGQSCSQQSALGLSRTHGMQACSERARDALAALGMICPVKMLRPCVRARQKGESIAFCVGAIVKKRRNLIYLLLRYVEREICRKQKRVTRNLKPTILALERRQPGGGV